ncbi:hypothetical protein ACP70R_024020 [Stipagrostis hirtigluma subsp. patula]
MTCTMAARQQKKRFANSNIPDQHRSNKKPKFDPPDTLLTLKSRIDLRWDDKLNKVIPRRDQIGISWSHLAPFIESPSKCPSGLADVACIPQEIFSLENLSGVLSHEAWATHLTEANRKFLTQFLPIGTSAEEVVRLLHTGQNHHFGNPFLRWSFSLCHGILHPDAVLKKEQQTRADKKAYHAGINNYHSGMIEILKKWKEKWLSCDSTESFYKHNPAKQEDLQLHGEQIIFSKGPKKEMPMKVVRNGDFSKFMSYIKISRSQHDLVKRMKQSGDGIQTKHLTRVIGDINNFHVKPYETLVEDEKKRLHNYWAVLSCKDIPTAFVARRDRELLIENLRKSVCLGLAQKGISVVEEAEQVTERTEEIGQDGARQSGDISDEQELVEISPQDMLQVGNDHNPVLEDEEVKDTTDTDTSCSHDSPDMKMKEHDVMDMNSTRNTSLSQNSSDGDQDLENISGTNSGTDNGSILDKKVENSEDMRYRNEISGSPGMEDEDSKDTCCIDTTLQDHNSQNMRAQDSNGITHKIIPIKGLHSSNMLVQDINNASCASLPIRDHGSSDEQDDGFKNITYPNASTGHAMTNIPSAISNQQMNHIIVDQKQAVNIAITPSHISLLFSKPLSEKGHVKENILPMVPTVKCEKGLWQTPNTVDTVYCRPESSLNTGSRDLQLIHHFSGGQATIVDMGRDIRSGQKAQVPIVAALPMLQPCTNQHKNQQLVSGAKGIAVAPSYSLGHANGIKQSIDQYSTVNNQVSQSAPVRDPLQGQGQLLDQSHNDLYLQQLQKNLHFVAGLCTQETFPMVERQSSAARTPVDLSGNWFRNEDTSHNNWSAMDRGVSEAQDLPRGSSADGSLFSVLSQYEQASSRVQLGAPSSNQSNETRSLVRPAQDAVPVAQNVALPTPDIYGYSSQSLPRNTGSHVDASRNNLQWANLTQESRGVPGPSFGQFQDPWSG